jgi:hypothetical protein
VVGGFADRPGFAFRRRRRRRARGRELREALSLGGEFGFFALGRARERGPLLFAFGAFGCFFCAGSRFFLFGGSRAAAAAFAAAGDRDDQRQERDGEGERAQRPACVRARSGWLG